MNSVWGIKIFLLFLTNIVPIFKTKALLFFKRRIHYSLALEIYSQFAHREGKSFSLILCEGLLKDFDQT